MENYSQLIIDLVDETEQLITYDKQIEDFGALKYTVENILEVIDKKRKHDVEALEALLKILEGQIKSIKLYFDNLK
jgi:hypothetical protein